MRSWLWRWSRLVVVSVGIPVDGHGLPEGDPPVVGQPLLHVHLVADVEMGDVVGVDRVPFKLAVVRHRDDRLAARSEGGHQLNHSLRELEIIVR